MKKGAKKLFYYFLLLIFCISLFTGCGSKSSTSESSNSPIKAQNQVTKDAANSKNGSKTENAKAENKETPSANSTFKPEQQLTTRKIIISSTIEMQTLKFDEALNTVQDKVEKIGGYIESSSITGRRLSEEDTLENRSAKFVLRIPKGNFDQFSTDISTLGNVINKNSSGQDVTSQYFDTEAHLKSLQIQEERLLELLKKTGELKDIIELEKELANVRYQIETLTGSLKKWDNLIDYSTLNLTIQEVQQISKAKTPSASLTAKMLQSFKNSINSLLSIGKWLLIAFSVILPYVVVLLLLCLIYYYAFRNRKIASRLSSKFKKIFKKE